MLAPWCGELDGPLLGAWRTRRLWWLPPRRAYRRQRGFVTGNELFSCTDQCGLTDSASMTYAVKLVWGDVMRLRSVNGRAER